MQNKKLLIISVVTLAVIALVVFFYLVSGGSRAEVRSDLDGFATCLTDKGVKFYGAYWCSHCQAQKALFGTAAGKLPYVECSTPDGQGENPICIQEGIKGYPTWVFTDGSRLSGEISLATLSEKSECVLPVASSTSSQ
ncbi:MAG: hypothetical protein UW92_C0013G0016 [Candidatus Jorgensenbacteria bacterium GW2011_GWA2_45_13]|uniref:Thioredoxin domain-containing protein n=1 Tax=Candidatus Jorgensenbacteria bacterium GW2011_GWA2_45_13 TaxID=1618662 RepID=A0A0G1NE15_9BACT|nr:MAG: hypothetical protein UW92_C0013G0016 [Candidatus Jorgensenbacteria bacterium GW2011_GWA2_45_13]